MGSSGLLTGEEWPRICCGRTEIVQPEPTANPLQSYADWKRAKAPPPPAVCRQSSAVGCAVLLIDTFVKDDSSLVDWLTLDQLSEFREACKEHEMQLALAGGIGFGLLETILNLQPDWIAVRGAVCLGGRQGTVCPNKVRELAQIVHAFPIRAGGAARLTVPS